jgi:serine protease
MLRLAALTSVVLFAFPAVGGAAARTVIRVPQDYPTVQGAINAAADGDLVLVSPGTYTERINFQSKNITVESVDGAASTILDGSGAGVVAIVNADPGETPTLRGFTIRNGAGGTSADGGVDTYGGPALIENNRIVGNHFCDGGAVEAAFSTATIRGNFISDNSQTSCSGGVGGGGISIRGAGTVAVLRNVITGNSHGSWGGGLTLFAAGTPTISGNTISDNSAGAGGGAMWIVNHSDALITNNVIVGNHASEQGGGILWLVPSGYVGPRVVNNTIAGNTAAEGSAVYADGYDVAARLQNNILTGGGSAAVLECGDFNDPNPPVIVHNDVFNFGPGPRYGGICSDLTGQNGNIAADPLFANAAGGDFRLGTISPAVEVGLNAGAPATDIEGDVRPFDSNGDGNAVVDIGADEVAPRFDNRPLAPLSLDRLRPPTARGTCTRGSGGLLLPAMARRPQAPAWLKHCA